MRKIGPIEELVLLGGGGLLKALVEWAQETKLPVRVVTSPRHANESLSGETLSDFLSRRGVPFLIAETLSAQPLPDFVAWNQKVLCLSIGAAWIFRDKELSSIFGRSLLNSHGTRLPQNRGGGGFSWQIMMGNRFGFCVLHEIDEGIDTGDIIESREFLYPAGARTPQDFSNVYERENLDFITDFIDRIRDSEQEFSPRKQSEWFSTYWPRLRTEISGQIDWSLDVYELERFICAFDDPYRGASTYVNSEQVFVRKVSLNLADGYFHPFQSGLVYRKTERWVCVAARGGSLVVESITDKQDRDFFSKVNVGDRFVTPNNSREEGLSRIRFNPTGLDNS